MSLKTKLSKKRFYDKWNYKVTFKVPGIGISRNHRLEDLINRLPLYTDQDMRSFLIKKFCQNSECIISLLLDLEVRKPELWQKRIQNDQIDIYTNDRDLYDDISLKFQDLVIHRFEPIGQSQEITDFDQILVNQFPHNIYEYKVYLTPHKYKKDKTMKKDFVSWLETQQNVHITESVKNWFIKTDWNWDRRYMYVKDRPTLLMVKLRSAEAVGKIYQHVILDK